MEFVDGPPITTYCDLRRLSLTTRLEVFCTVCDAVQHAHRKGIIHRDLKPSNLLVCELDGLAIPKVIDFGVATLCQQPNSENSSTQIGQIIGTLDYMSPEQSHFDVIDIDTRSDVYSLGVVLYELLTGYVPFEAERSKDIDWGERLRIIREEEPTRPSRRLAESATSSETASLRRLASRSLRSMLEGELDDIVMKAMAKDRSDGTTPRQNLPLMSNVS